MIGGLVKQEQIVILQKETGQGNTPSLTACFSVSGDGVQLAVRSGDIEGYRCEEFDS